MRIFLYKKIVKNGIKNQNTKIQNKLCERNRRAFKNKNYDELYSYFNGRPPGSCEQNGYKLSFKGLCFIEIFDIFLTSSKGKIFSITPLLKKKLFP